MSELEVAIVTGGAQGIGAAICETLLKRGYKVCVSDIQDEKGTQFVTEQQKIYGAEIVKFIHGDVAKEEDYKDLFEFTLKQFKRIDLVVNNAGVVKEKNERLAIDINLMGPIIGCKLALEYMGKSNGGKGGMVINTASVTGLVPFHAAPVYSATKHGIVGLTRSYGLPYYLEKDGVLFAALCPSFTATGLGKDSSIAISAKDIRPVHCDDLMTPKYVAEGVVKLLEDRINGSVLLVTKKEGYTYVGYPEEIKKTVLKKEAQSIQDKKQTEEESHYFSFADYFQNSI